MAATSLRGIFNDPDKVTDDLLDLVYAELNKPKAGVAFRSFQKHEVHWKGMNTVYMDRLDEIQLTSLIIHGEKDYLVPLHFAMEAHTRLSGSQVRIILGASHWVQREEPGQFSETVSMFLRD